MPLLLVFGFTAIAAFVTIPIFGWLTSRAEYRIERWIAYLCFLPTVLGLMIILGSGRPPASSLRVQRVVVGPVARTTSTALSTQGGQYYGPLDGFGCSNRDVSVLNTAPPGSYVVLEQRVVTEWTMYPFTTTGPMPAQCTTSFHR